MIVRVVAPLSTVLVPGSPTEVRMPWSAWPARSSALVSTALRGAVETNALQRAGNAEQGIRTSVGDPGTHTVDKGATTRTIIAAPEGDGQNARAVIPG